METKLRAMRHRDVLHVVTCDNTGLVKAKGGSLQSEASDIEYYLRQQFHMMTVAADCHGIPRGYLHAFCGTNKNFAELRRLVVHADWWNMGIGEQLLSSFVIQCRDADMDIHCDVPFAMLPASANYLKRFGFRGTGLHSFDDEQYAAMAWTPPAKAVVA